MKHKKYPAKVYPIVLTPSETSDKIIVYVPDFEINTEGEDQADAIYMARDAISIVGLDMIENGEKLPKSSSIKEVNDEYSEDTVSLVDVNFDTYRKRLDTRTVRKNCTIPKWLNEEAEKSGINFSNVLQEGLKARLGYKA